MEQTRFRVRSEYVTVRTGNTPGVGSGGYLAVGVDHGRLLPADVPAADVARLLRRGFVELVDGAEVPVEVQAELDKLEAAHYRPPDPAPTPRERLVEAAWRAGIHAGEPLVEFVAAVEALVDERVAAALDGSPVDA
jgi:hypothetical protein